MAMTTQQAASARLVAAGLLRSAFAYERDGDAIHRTNLVIELRERAKNLIREADETDAAKVAGKEDV